MAEYRVPTHEIDWKSLIAPEHWRKYKCVLDRAIREQVPFALGGGLAVGVYTGKGRYTKDLDLYILPEHRDWAINVVSQCGLQDYHETKPYDRNWIYRAHDGDVIVDSIWAMAQQASRCRLGMAGAGSRNRHVRAEVPRNPPRRVDLVEAIRAAA